MSRRRCQQARAKQRGQSTVEYAVGITVVAAALLGTSLFAKRAFQGRYRRLAESLSDRRYEPKRTSSDSLTTVSSLQIANFVRSSVPADPARGLTEEKDVAVIFSESDAVATLNLSSSVEEGAALFDGAGSSSPPRVPGGQPTNCRQIKDLGDATLWICQVPAGWQPPPEACCTYQGNGRFECPKATCDAPP